MALAEPLVIADLSTGSTVNHTFVVIGAEGANNVAVRRTSPIDITSYGELALTQGKTSPSGIRRVSFNLKWVRSPTGLPQQHVAMSQIWTFPESMTSVGPADLWRVASIMAQLTAATGSFTPTGNLAKVLLEKQL